jgi:NAD(P)-dependent dehydrogenase (short-subunit alcohol dehydrogenase family)
MRLLGKKTIVTGANRSIGKAIALAFAKEGADVVISYRSDQTGALEVADEIKKLGRQAEAIFADFSIASGVDQFFDLAVDFLGEIDVLVNNAAAYNTDSFLDLLAADFEALLKINVTAPMILSQSAARYMISKQVQGSIINISSISGNRPYPNRAALASSKAALNMLTQCTALDLALYRIRVNGIAPGSTPYNEDSQAPCSYIPLGRTGKADDHAKVAIFLASDESSWMTGQILSVDGGQSLSFSDQFKSNEGMPIRFE